MKVFSRTKNLTDKRATKCTKRSVFSAPLFRLQTLLAMASSVKSNLIWMLVHTGKRAQNFSASNLLTYNFITGFLTPDYPNTLLS